eukprot:TRINITY_DN21622_c0_g1_i1.p1 TRINITY_DN21622_c0_g1~~TRINITY_DN21622_c0_g1_i1.p1  ORF type:complete len:661 (+),score=101.83 TRINITY_DN21622_c0_g1_i1:152-2134(+)
MAVGVLWKVSEEASDSDGIVDTDQSGGVLDFASCGWFVRAARFALNIVYLRGRVLWRAGNAFLGAVAPIQGEDDDDVSIGEEDLADVGSASPVGAIEDAHVRVVASYDFWLVQLEAIYRRRNPYKLEKVPKLLEKYSGRELILYRKVCHQYGMDASRFYANSVAADLETSNAQRQVEASEDVLDVTLDTTAVVDNALVDVACSQDASAVNCGGIRPEVTMTAASELIPSTCSPVVASAMGAESTNLSSLKCTKTDAPAVSKRPRSTKAATAATSPGSSMRSTAPLAPTFSTTSPRLPPVTPEVSSQVSLLAGSCVAASPSVCASSFADSRKVACTHVQASHIARPSDVVSIQSRAPFGEQQASAQGDRDSSKRKELLRAPQVVVDLRGREGAARHTLLLEMLRDALVRRFGSLDAAFDAAGITPQGRVTQSRLQEFLQANYNIEDGGFTAQAIFSELDLAGKCFLSYSDFCALRFLPTDSELSRVVAGTVSKRPDVRRPKGGADRSEALQTPQHRRVAERTASVCPSRRRPNRSKIAVRTRVDSHLRSSRKFAMERGVGVKRCEVSRVEFACTKENKWTSTKIEKMDACVSDATFKKRATRKRLLDMHCGPWLAGDQVEYCSASAGKWISARIKRRRRDGRYDLNVKLGALPCQLRPVDP